MSQLASLTKYFRGGNAEAEKDIRGEIFVTPANMETLLGFDFHSNVILLGNKGVGKSIFVSVLSEAYLRNGEVSVLLTPDELQCDSILSKKTLADRKSAAYGQILATIAGILGKHSNESELAVSTDVVALQKLAIKEGYTKADLMSKFSSFLTKITPIAGKIAAALLKEQATPLGKNNLKEVVDKYLTVRKKTLWLFIDDIDAAVAKNSRGAFDYAACWAIVSAAIELSEDIRAIRCVVSVRSDIWHLMTRTHGHGAERKDKLGQIHELKYSEEEIQAIFNRRIDLASYDAKSLKKLGTFFEQSNLTLPGIQGIKRDWDKWLAKLSRNKPRDLVKAVQMLITEAKKTQSNLIGDKQAHEILYQYGAERVDNIVDEYGQVCPQIKSVIDDLTQQNVYSFTEIVDMLKKVPSRRATQVDGVGMHSTNEDVVRLLRLLHMACFLNPRLDTDDVYTHLNFGTDPDLVDIANYNDLQQYSWQVHPTFHTYSARTRKKAEFRS